MVSNAYSSGGRRPLEHAQLPTPTFDSICALTHTKPLVHVHAPVSDTQDVNTVFESRRQPPPPPGNIDAPVLMSEPRIAAGHDEAMRAMRQRAWPLPTYTCARVELSKAAFRLRRYVRT